MRLDLYSEKLLTRKVQIELWVVAAALLFVFLFELAAWSFFLNGLFVGDMHDFHPVGTTIALVLALLFAGTVLYFERQVIVADTIRLEPRDKRRAKWLRITFIVVGALIVAHAVDLLAFRDPIDRQLHSEAVHDHLRRLTADLAEMRTTLLPGAEDVKKTDDEIERVNRRIDAANTALIAAIGDEGSFGAAAKDFQRRKPTVSTSADGIPPSAEELRAAIERDRQAAQWVGGRVGAAQTAAAVRDQIKQLDVELRVLNDEKRGWNDSAQRSRRILQQLASRLASWSAELETAEPGSRTEVWEAPSFITADDRRLWSKNWQRDFVFDEPHWSFFEKIGALYGLLRSRPEAGDPSTAAASAPSRGRAPRLPGLYRGAIVTIHLAAMFVPFLVFTIKWFFTSSEVNAYFSTWHEAHAGDREAQLMLNVEERVRESLAQLRAADGDGRDG